MRIVLHIGLENCGNDRLQSVFASKRDQLSGKSVRYASSPGKKNHTRLWMAVTDPGHIDPLRYNRGYITAQKQSVLLKTLAQDLAREVDTHRPETLILSASQLSWLARTEELERLKALLVPLTEDIQVLAYVDAPAQVLARTYASQILEGRATSLERDLRLARSGTFWESALQEAPAINPQAGQFLETQAAPFWLDYARLVEHWDHVFGAGATQLRSYDPARFDDARFTDELSAAFDISASFGKAPPDRLQPAPSAAWLARARSMNDLLLTVLEKRDLILPRQLWRSFLNDINIEGVSIQPNELASACASLTQSAKALCKKHSGLNEDQFADPLESSVWEEAPLGNGYRASQYVLSHMWRIEKATQEARKSKAADLAHLKEGAHDPAPAPPNGLSEAARKLMPPLAVQNFAKLQTSSFAPHNKMGAVNEEDLAAAYAPCPPRSLREGTSGNVIVGCMKNEAPYILEWVAYHRAIGVDNFLIYTNGCEDGTSQLLDRLQEMGVLQHRLNDDWSGNSPQQYALNRALEEPVIRNADWIIHIDVDEFMNVRCGNGTLDDFFARVPDATNVAMTWRLFGHNDVIELSDDLVIDQFDTCAPKFCPKPHTVWGFKTMFKNIGAYQKISCHRPNKLLPEAETQVKWVNGSGRDMTDEVAKNGWRNSKKSIGYDLIQLNHYALRSAESFLIKRQRGRALHVDRSIGLNYWIRMDWGDHRDITIKRNIPRVRAEIDRLMQDSQLRKLHEDGSEWHRSKAHELHQMKEFRELYEQALNVKLTQTERVAYALALDMES